MHSLPDAACKVKRCEANSPRDPLPSRADSDKGDHGAIYVSALARYQFKSCMGNNYPPVVAHSRDLIYPRVAQMATPHRPIEAPPMQGSKKRGNDDIDIGAERIVR